MQDETKRKKGRPAGSNSFVKVRVTDLVNLVGDNAVVPISKVWMRENNISVQSPVAMAISTATEEREEEKIEFNLTSFDD